MESVKYICPTCHTGVSTRHCPSCDYDLNQDKLLVNLVQSEYNRALTLAQNRNYLEAWRVIRDSVTIYPYLHVPIKFAYYLAIEVGEYRYAHECLNRLRPVLTDEQFQVELQHLKNQVKSYNQILQYKGLQSSTSHDLSFIQYYLLHLLSGEKQQKKNYLKILAGFDSSFSDVLKFRTRPLKPWKYMVLGLSLALLGSFSIAFFIFKNTNRELSGTKNQLGTLHDRNDSLNTVLFTFTDSLSRLQGARPGLLEETEKSKLLSNFLMHYHNNEYENSANILVDHAQLIPVLKQSKLTSLIEDISEYLYTSKNYISVVGINYDSHYTPHAMYQLINLSNDADLEERIDKLKKYVDRYPHHPSYAAPFLRELFDYYKESDRELAYKYANRLQEYLSIYPDPEHMKYFSSEVSVLLNKRD